MPLEGYEHMQSIGRDADKIKQHGGLIENFVHDGDCCRTCLIGGSPLPEAQLVILKRHQWPTRPIPDKYLFANFLLNALLTERALYVNNRKGVCGHSVVPVGAWHASAIHHLH